MKEARLWILGFSLVAVLLFAAGCAPKLMCAPPSSIIGNSCCIDADKDGVCDADAVPEEGQVEAQAPELQEPVAEGQEVVVEEELTPYESFAETFAAAWDGKSYNALRNLFVKDYRLKFSQNEFGFLARKVDSQIGMMQVRLMDVDGNTARYEVILPDKKLTVYANIAGEDGAFKHEPFYFFGNLSADAACLDDESCYVSFAVISGNRNYCDDAGSLKADCVAKFGVSKTMTQMIDECMEVSEYYTRAECLTQLAQDENDIEPCWQAGYDKQVFECMGLVAALRSNVDECNTFVAAKGYPGTRLQKTYCILGYVKETGDTDACAKIDRRGDTMLGSLQEGCYRLSFP
jgi:hypothetical protein